jgi:hypothetical protein
METTAAALKRLLSQHFDGVEHVAQQCRRAGLIPAGGPGYGGVRSARLSPLGAALLLLACASGTDPVDAPAAARTLASYRLRAIFVPAPTFGPAARVRQDVPSRRGFGRWAADELERIARHPAASVAGWELEPPCWILTFNADERRQPPPRLRLVSSEPDLYFAPDDPPEVRALPRPAVRHVAIVEPGLIRSVAALFAAGSAATRAA